MRQIKEREVWRAWVKYEENPDEGKYRPVLVAVVDCDEQNALVIPITSTAPRDEYDIELFDWADIPLDHLSTARASKSQVIPFADFAKRIGFVSKDDWDNVMGLYTDFVKTHPWG